MPPKPCTARVTWAAVVPAPRPDDCPKWHRCVERGPHAQHRVTWQRREYRWTPERGGARKGAGRKPTSPTGETRSESLQLPMTPSERAEVDAAWGEFATPKAREAVLRAARRRR